MTSWNKGLKALNAGYTPAIDALYEYLVAYNSVHGRLPTQKEIAFDLDRDHSVISKQMRVLAEQGKLIATYSKVQYSLRDE